MKKTVNKNYFKYLKGKDKYLLFMWVSKEINSFGKKSLCSSVGEINQVNGSDVCVEDDSEYRDIPIVCPYGIVSVPVIGSEAIFAPLSSGFFYLGCKIKNREDLKPGEVGIYSHGGASIVLKNDGRVLINGNEIN